MIVFHGSNQIVRNPDTRKGRINIDFGQGFYTTSYEKQAIKWAVNKATFIKKYGTKPIINIYEYSENNSLKKLLLNEYNEQWLDIVANFRGAFEESINLDFDIIIGKVANDQIITEINSYIDLLKQNRITKNVKNFYLELFSYAKENDQICFKTDASIKTIKFLDFYEVKNV